MKHARSLGRTCDASIGASSTTPSASAHATVGTASITASGRSTTMQCRTAGVVSAPMVSTARDAKSPCTMNTAAPESASWWRRNSPL